MRAIQFAIRRPIVTVALLVTGAATLSASVTAVVLWLMNEEDKYPC